ncbi:MAG: inositol monophosphatase [Flavobacteriales bacterium]|nr:inositol monophosphatase [Flavobacteriales bacterium]
MNVTTDHLQQLIPQMEVFLNQLRKQYFNSSENRYSQLDLKSRNQLVTDLDVTIERKLVEFLGNLLPGSVFLTEEKTIEQEHGRFLWIIDPIDGTTNFVHGIPAYCISIALMVDGEIVLGVVFELNRGEFFHALKNGGAYLDHNPIRVSTSAHIQNALIATGFPYYDYKRTSMYLVALEAFMKETRGVRRLGSAALDLAYVACGRFDAFFEYSLSPWDVAAGALLVKEAGGSVHDFHGKDQYLFGQEIIASQPLIAKSVIEIIQHAFEIA